MNIGIGKGTVQLGPQVSSGSRALMGVVRTSICIGRGAVQLGPQVRPVGHTGGLAAAAGRRAGKVMLTRFGTGAATLGGAAVVFSMSNGVVVGRMGVGGAVLWSGGAWMETLPGSIGGVLRLWQLPAAWAPAAAVGLCKLMRTGGLTAAGAGIVTPPGSIGGVICLWQLPGAWAPAAGVGLVKLMRAGGLPTA